jgi:hypothetical protein
MRRTTMSKCVVRFSDGILKWVCDVHNEPGGCDEYGCLQGAREYIAELEAELKVKVSAYDIGYTQGERHGRDGRVNGPKYREKLPEIEEGE